MITTMNRWKNCFPALDDIQLNKVWNEATIANLPTPDMKSFTTVEGGKKTISDMISDASASYLEKELHNQELKIAAEFLINSLASAEHMTKLMSHDIYKDTGFPEIAGNVARDLVKSGNFKGKIDKALKDSSNSLLRPILNTIITEKISIMMDSSDALSEASVTEAAIASTYGDAKSSGLDKLGDKMTLSFNNLREDKSKSQSILMNGGFPYAQA